MSTDINIVLDRSGSMCDLAEETIVSINKFLAEQRLVPGECWVSLYTFNHEYTPVYEGKPIIWAPNLTSETYRPDGWTAYYDALEKTIDRVGVRLSKLPYVERPNQVLLVVVTDGLDNRSAAGALKRVREKVAHQETVYSWQFVFLGANLDAARAGAELNIARGNTLQYQATLEGIRTTYDCLSSLTTNYRNSGVSNTKDFVGA